jgi:DNA polymerase I-like protein with 3'-5' exonuclease and polymerase domains
MSVSTELIDLRNVAEKLNPFLDKLRAAKLFGLDCETTDVETRHEGLNAYNTKTKLVFDHRRTTMTGFSIYLDDDDVAYYFNLNHADVENRLPAEIISAVLDEVPDDAIGVAHNLPFELVMFKQCYGRDLKNFVCTLQMAVSHHNPDEYDLFDFQQAGLPAKFLKIAKDIIPIWADYDGRLNSEQQELLSKFIAKESKAEHSYNGFVKSIAKGYSLKRLTKSRFGVDQMTFQEVLGDKEHMGQLTGEEVAEYGADDAYWAVQHYKWLLADMLENNPKALIAFLKTENPMVYIYAESWLNGVRLNLGQVFARREIERAEMAKTLRDFKVDLKDFLPFPPTLNQKLAEKEAWYAKGGEAKRNQIVRWVNSPNVSDDFAQTFQVSNPIGNAWAIEKGIKVPKSGKLNIVYYHGMRTIMYDMLGLRIEYDEGSVTSDKDARGRARERLEKVVDEGNNRHKLKVMESLQKMADIEQRMKLYLTPYTQLMDPETGRVYPSLSSQLATRRLATSFPNPMQLAKSGGSAYIRGFYLGDTDEHVVVSADWSAIELVLIGDFSGDREFAKVYSQIPYGDMHSGAAVDALSVKTLEGLTEAEFREFKFGRNPNNRVLRDLSGAEVSASEFYKFARGTAVGKGVNFSYWYSGALSTVANNLGMSDDQHWELVDRYRARFPEAEAWRISKQEEAVANGFITLADGHRRTRYEATPWWHDAMHEKFRRLSAAPGLLKYADVAVRRLQSRAKNQVVNADIQGTCATLAKRTILKVRDAVGPLWGKEVRLMMPIHDELVWSVHKDYVLEFIPILRACMVDHKDIVTRLPLHSTVAMGRTFRPFDKTDPRRSQIELDEAQVIEGVIGQELEGTALSDDKIADVLEYIFS